MTPQAANTAMAFPAEDSKALKAYGLPTNVLVDVSGYEQLMKVRPG